MKYKAVLFDLDGTLLNTLQDIADSVNCGLRKLGFRQLEVDAYKLLVGEGREALALGALPQNHREAETVKELLAYINEEYSTHWADNTRPYQGVPELLDALTRNRIELAVLSNKADDLTKLAVSRLLSRWHFSQVIGAMPSLPKKPDPTGALQIVKHLKMNTSQCLYLGDSGIDMRTASSAGMYAVGALWGFRSADELLASGAKTLVKHPREFLGLLC